MATVLRLAMIGIALLASAAAIGMKRPPRKNEALYKCLNQQICGCGMASRFNECWKEMTENGKKWFLDQVNKCEGVDLPYGDVKEWSDVLCPLDEDVKKPCYHEVNEKMVEQLKRTGSGEFGEAETIAYEVTRKCLEPNLAFCATFPDDCMSVG